MLYEYKCDVVRVIDGDTHELIEALEKADERASVKIMIKDYADGWFEAAVSKRMSVGELIQALAIQPQAEVQPGVGEPTEEMLIAGNAVMDEYANEQIDRRWEVRDLFKAMLKAAPAQPASDVRERVVQIIMRSFSSMPSTPTWQDREKATYEIADAILAALSATTEDKRYYSEIMLLEGHAEEYK